jgi:hypothetical protein
MQAEKLNFNKPLKISLVIINEWLILLLLYYRKLIIKFFGKKYSFKENNKNKNSKTPNFSIFV